MNAAQFYVYELIDPRDGSVFYVGKGKGRRIHGHEAEARRGVYSRKCARIRDIWAAGGNVSHSFVSWHVDENEALQAEHECIAHHGLGNLTNVVPGGTIGIQAYLSRQAEVARRQEEKSNRAFAKGFYDLAPKFAEMFRAKGASGGFGVQVGARWLEFSEPLESLFWEMVAAVGWTEAKTAMSKYGVQLIEASHGAPKPQA